MRQRRRVLSTGLAVVSASIAGCVENVLPEEIADPETGGPTDAPTSGNSPASSSTATATRKPPTGLVAVAATGTNVDGKFVSTVRVTVEKAAGTEQIDLAEVLVEWTDPAGEYRVVPSSVESSKAHGHFGIVPGEGATDADGPVIDAAGERYDLVFDLGRDATAVDDPDDGVSGRPSFGRRVEAGWTVTLRLTTGAGTTTTAELTVPDAVGGRESVTLL